MEIRSICEDREETLWAGTLGNGVIRLSFTGTDTLITTYGTQHGLPSLKNNHICRLEKGVVFATAKGIYRFDDRTETFLPDSSFPERYRNGSMGIHRMVSGEEGSYWLACYRENRHWMELLRTMPGGSFHTDTLPFKTLPHREMDAVYPDTEGITWFGISNELYSYRKGHPAFDHPEFYTLIRKVVAGTDSMLFRGIAPPRGDLSPVSLPWSLNRVGFEFAAPFFIMEEKTRYSYLLEGLQDDWSAWSPEPRVTFNNLREGKYVFRVRAMNGYGQVSPAADWQFVISPPWYRSTLAWLSYFLLASLGIFSIVRWNTHRLEKEKQQLETLVTERTREVIRQKEEIEKQRDLARRQKKRIENQNRDIRDSIKYARRIQKAILPPEDFLSDFIPECFVMNLPKDIVSGDFYWFTEKNDRLIIAVADCTGHGVPGAFMSMLGMAYLNEIVNKSHIIQPAEILYYLRIYVINSLHQSGGVGESRDGMDISLFTIHTGSLELEFAGAYHSLLIIREGKLHVLKGERMPIGIHEQMNKHFTNHLFNLQKNDRLYAFTDGYADQFGGPSDKKITSGLMKKWLLEIHRRDMKTQREILENRFLEWKGKKQQVDDILMVGLKI